MSKRDEILELCENAELFQKKTDGAILGYVERACDSDYVLYDKEKLIELSGKKPKYKETHLYFVKATLKQIADIDNGEMLTADGFDKAIIGYAETFNGNRFVIYDTEKCWNLLAKDIKKELKLNNPKMKKVDIEDEAITTAIEYFYFNTAGAYMGEKTPGFATLFNE